MLSYTHTTQGMSAGLPPFLTVAQVQDLLQVGRGSVYRQIDLYFSTGGAEGIPAVRVGRLIRVPRQALIAQMTADPAAGLTPGSEEDGGTHESSGTAP